MRKLSSGETRAGNSNSSRTRSKFLSGLLFVGSLLIELCVGELDVEITLDGHGDG